MEQVTMTSIPSDIPNREVMFVVRDADSDAVQPLRMTHTEHSLVRSSQRGINRLHIEMAIRYGKSIYRQGLVFCILGWRDIPYTHAHMRDKLSGTVLVLSGDDDSIVTCYRGSDPFKHIMRKPSRLSRLRA